jgi:uncharacterized repeat protein (TIGR02543 family)
MGKKMRNEKKRIKAFSVPLFFLFPLLVFHFSCENPIQKAYFNFRNVTYNTNGGSAVASQRLMRDDQITKPADPTKSGNTFEGWYEDNGTFTNRYDFTKTPQSDLTLHAKWNGHTHVWGAWIVTTAPTYIAEGVETRVCVLDPTHKETRPIERIPIPAADFAAALASLPANSPATPYTIKLDVNNSSFSNLLGILNNEPNKYVNLDLSGSTISSIHDGAFYDLTNYVGCDTLIGIIIPNGVARIGDQAFFKCVNLASITIPGSVTSIGDWAFWGCTSLTSITIPDSVTSIGEESFASCTSLTSVVIPAGVNIGTSAFDYCIGLSTVTFKGAIPSSNFSSINPFPGDLRAKFYATDPINGTSGVYTTTNPGINPSWTKQP